MRIQDLIIGLMIFAACGLSIFSFTAQLYNSETGLNVSMDSYTQSKFDMLNTNLQATQSQTGQMSNTFQTYAPGGGNQTLSGNTLTASDLATAAWKSLMQLPTLLGIFSGMVGVIGNALGIDASFVGFIIGALIISVILTIIGITFYREVL